MSTETLEVPSWVNCALMTMGLMEDEKEKANSKGEAEREEKMSS